LIIEFHGIIESHLPCKTKLTCTYANNEDAVCVRTSVRGRERR
jgi:hypothetical protein